MEKFRVFIKSPVHGRDVFKFDTAEKARENYKLLRDTAARHTERDGIPRTVSLGIKS